MADLPTLREFLLEKFPGAFTEDPKGIMDWKTHDTCQEGEETLIFNYNDEVEKEAIFSAIVEFYQLQGFEVKTNAMGGGGHRKSDYAIRSFVVTTQNHLRITVAA